MGATYDRLRTRFSTDKVLSEKGIWITIDLEDGGPPVKFLIAQLSRVNRKWANQASRVYREHKRRIDAGLMSDEESVEKSLRVFCNTVLLDWEGIDDVDGKPILYTPDEGFRYLSECDKLYDYLLEESQAVSNYQDKVIGQTVGKSQNTSAGS